MSFGLGSFLLSLGKGQGRGKMNKLTKRTFTYNHPQLSLPIRPGQGSGIVLPRQDAQF
jgi:hypothetical protein